MNENERTLLNNFLTRLREAQGVPKDAEADVLIREAVSRQPDAAYLLVQKAFLLEQALAAAKAQLAEAQRQLHEANTVGASSFLRGSQASAQGWSDPTPAAPAHQPPPQVTPSRSGFFSAGSGFLGTAAAAAAGTVAGGFLFEGIENLLHHNSGSVGGADNFLGDTGGFRTVTENTVVNNYYGDNVDNMDQDQNDDFSQDQDYSDDDSDSTFV